MSDHIADKAAFVAALAPDDPERFDAEAHARSCAECAEALAKGRALVALLDRAAAPAPPSAEALASTAAAIEEERVREREARILVPSLAAAVLVAWGLELAISKKLAHDAASIAISLGWALSAAALGAWAIVRSRWAIVGAVIASAALVLVAWGSDMDPHAVLGMKCTLLELVAAAGPFGVALALARRRHVALEPLRASAVAAAGALAGHAALHLSCKVPHAGVHLLAFHFGGVLLAALIAAAGAQRLRPAPAA